jgi:hypothetical protein
LRRSTSCWRRRMANHLANKLADIRRYWEPNERQKVKKGCEKADVPTLGDTREHPPRGIPPSAPFQTNARTGLQAHSSGACAPARGKRTGRPVRLACDGSSLSDVSPSGDVSRPCLPAEALTTWSSRTASHHLPTTFTPSNPGKTCANAGLAQNSFPRPTAQRSRPGWSTLGNDVVGSQLQGTWTDVGTLFAPAEKQAVDWRAQRSAGGGA